MNADETTHVNSPTDNQLMLEVRNGDIRKLALLFERHHVTLFNYLLRLTRDRERSEDMVQDVFLRILKFRHTFRGDGEFGVWMYHIARNVHADQYRKQRERTLTNDEFEMISDDPNPNETAERRERIDLLRQAMERLSVEQRELLMLSRYQQMKYDAIGSILGCSVGAVKVRVHRAMKELRTIFLSLTGESAP